MPSLIAKPSLPPPAPLIVFRCSSCGAESRYTREELSEDPGITIWRRPCSCGGRMHRQTGPQATP